jgi:hypothetical protein
MSARNLLAACLCTLAFSLSIHAQGFKGNLNLVQASSNLVFSGDLAPPPFTTFTPFTGQGSGNPSSLTTTYTGTVNVTIELVANTIVFNGAAAVAQNSGSWAPKADLTLGTDPANYGIQHAATGTTAAVRNLSVTMTSTSLILTPAGAGIWTFPSTQLLAYLPGGILDLVGGLLSNGHYPLTASAANTAVPNGTLTALGGSSFQLSLPFDVAGLIKQGASTTIGHTDLAGTLLASGSLVAIPEPTTYALIGLSVGAAGFFSYRHKKRLKKQLDASLRKS